MNSIILTLFLTAIFSQNCQWPVLPLQLYFSNSSCGLYRWWGIQIYFTSSNSCPFYVYFFLNFLLELKKTHPSTHPIFCLRNCTIMKWSSLVSNTNKHLLLLLSTSRTWWLTYFHFSLLSPCSYWVLSCKWFIVLMNVTVSFISSIHLPTMSWKYLYPKLSMWQYVFLFCFYRWYRIYLSSHIYVSNLSIVVSHLILHNVIFLTIMYDFTMTANSASYD